MNKLENDPCVCGHPRHWHADSLKPALDGGTTLEHPCVHASPDGEFGLCDCTNFDQYDENTLEALALDMWEVCDQLEAEGLGEAAQSLRDQCECVVRDHIMACVRDEEVSK